MTPPKLASPFVSKVRHRPSQQWIRIRLFQESSPWVANCVARIAELSKLPRDWDSYDSDPIARAAIKMALKFLAESPLAIIPEPSVSPVPGGGIGLHWRTENRDLELEFLPDGTLQFLKSDKSRPEQPAEEGTVTKLGQTELWRWLAGETT